MNSQEPIYVTQPCMPPLEDFLPFLESIWSSKTLTNGGPFHARLEKSLCEYLGVEHLSLFNNGTIALLTALQVLQISGEVITTPFSFVATAHSLLWNNLTPVFVDVDPETLNLDPTRIESAITPNTTAILPVHVYGHPCDVDAIQAVADKYKLKVIYDAAHAFGVRCHCGSVLNHGDLSVLSFHATKVFNTFEGGAIVCKDAATKRYIDQLKNFGFVDEVTVVVPGINGKMNEVSAAFGLLQLDRIEGMLASRRAIDARYRARLNDIAGLRCLGDSSETTANYGYFPILVDASFPLTRDALYRHLQARGIFGRRYFYPLITDFPMYRKFPSASRANLPVASAMAESVLCLPIYPGLSMDDQDRVLGAIDEVVGRVVSCKG